MANKILGFGTSATNELSDAAYAADAQRLSGNVPGVARSSLVNKVLHQASTIVAGIAQFLADRTSTDIVDTLTPQQVADLLSANIASPLVASARNLRGSLAAANNSATFTADQVVLTTAIAGGRFFSLASFSKTINLATVGAGGMDVGTAPNGFVAVYAIYNPTTGVSALLGTNATAAAAPSVYGGANMPAGYTASALISVLATTTATGFAPFAQIDRAIACVQVLSQSINTTTSTPVSWSPTTLPKNAIECSGSTTYTSSAASSGGTSVFGNPTGLGGQGNNVTISVGGVVTTSFSGVLMTNPQTLYYTGTSSGGTPTYQVSLNGYKI